MPEAQLTIKELLHALDRDVVWRLDWLGNITSRGNHNAQHEFSAFFSPLARSRHEAITHPEAVDFSRQTRVMLGVGYLPLLYIGALFRNGHLLDRPRDRIKRQRFSVGAMGSPRYLSLNEVLNMSKREGRQLSLLHPHEFDIGQRAWPHAGSSQVLALSDADRLDPHHVLIPCMEVMRFFFCLTSVLATHLLQSGWQSLLWMEGSSIAQMPGSITVGSRVVRGLVNEDHRHLAYMLVCERTRTAVEGVFQSLQVTMPDRGVTVGLKCPLPFDEPTSIEAEVVTVPTDEAPGQRHLVTRLLSCKRPIPFARCFANPVLNPLQGDNWDSPDLLPIDLGGSPEETQDTAAPKVTPVARDPGGRLMQGLTGDDLGTPTRGMDPIVLREQEDRFIGLSGIPIELAPKKQQKYRSAPRPRLVKPVDMAQASTAIPERGSKPSVIAANARVDPPLPAAQASADEFFEECACLLRGRGLKTHALSRPIPIIRARGYRAWATIEPQDQEADDSQPRPRSLNLLLISKDGIRIVVADIQRRLMGTGESYALVAYRPVGSISIGEFITDLLTHVSLVKRLPNEAHNRRPRPAHGALWEARRKTTHKSNDTAHDFVRRLESKLIWPLLTKRG